MGNQVRCECCREDDYAIYCDVCGHPVPGVSFEEIESYWAILPAMKDLGRRLGWCLAVYGPLCRNLDMVAVPWCTDAVPHDELLRELVTVFGGRYSNHQIDPSTGRTGVTVACSKRLLRDNGSYVDVSVIDPRINSDNSNTGLTRER